MHGAWLSNGGPPPGSHVGGTAEQTSVGANLPPQLRPKGTRKPSKKYVVGVRFGPPRTPGPLAARAAHSSVYFCHCGKRGSTWLKSRKLPLTSGPVQPSCHSMPVAWSICFSLCMSSLRSESWVPLMNISLTVLTVPGPGSMPL